jgi:hypothetical protein
MSSNCPIGLQDVALNTIGQQDVALNTIGQQDVALKPIGLWSGVEVNYPL